MNCTQENSEAGGGAGPVCPRCGRPMVRKLGGFGPYYDCQDFPRCDTRIGCDPKTREPRGVPADTETRHARCVAHAAFDRLWKGVRPIMKRGEAYRWLAASLGVPEAEAHIAFLDAERCREVYDLVCAKLTEIRRQRRTRYPREQEDEG